MSSPEPASMQGDAALVSRPPATTVRRTSCDMQRTCDRLWTSPSGRYSDSALAGLLLLNYELPSQASPLTLVEMDHVHRLSADIAKSGHPFQPPNPEEAEKYAHKPLPPLPSPSYFRKRDSSSSSMGSGLRITSPDENAEGPAMLPPSTQRDPSSRHNNMLQPKTHHLATGNRSSRKVMQITGHQLDTMEHSPMKSARIRKPLSTMSLSESGWAAFGGSAALRMGYFDQKEESSSVPPLLEADREGSSKSHDSWEPVSPDAAQPAPWLSDATVAEAHHDSDFSGRAASIDSDSKVRELFQLHSNDLEVAWSYHTIASELAAPKRPATSHAPEETTRHSFQPKPLRFTKLLHSDPSRRLRSTLPAIVTSLEPRPASRYREKTKSITAHPDSVGGTARPATAASATRQAPPQSAFDESDSEDDEQGRWGGSPGFKDWLARRSGDGYTFGHSPTRRRSSELSKPSLVAKTGGHMRGLLGRKKQG